MINQTLDIIPTATIYFNSHEDRPDDHYPEKIELPTGIDHHADPETRLNNFLVLKPYLHTYLRLVYVYDDNREEIVFFRDIEEHNRENGSRYDLLVNDLEEWFEYLEEVKDYEIRQGSHWKNKKTQYVIYQVAFEETHSETLEPMISYYAPDGKRWTRPKWLFLEKFEEVVHHGNDTDGVF